MPLKKKNAWISSKRPRGRRATQFQCGSGLNPFTSEKSTSPSFDADAGEPRTVKQPQSMKRITTREAEDVQFVSGEVSELAYTLRPNPEMEENSCKNNETEENIIVNMGKMTELLRHMHATTCKKGKIRACITRRVGLCVYMSLHCEYCGYQSPVLPMSETVSQKKGTPAGVLNSMLILPVLKSKIGLDDASNVLSCLNIKPPSKTVLQRKMNFLSNYATEISEQNMAENQRYVAKVLATAGAEPSVDVQFDVAYAVRPQGGCEKAGQSFGALIEHTTSRKLPLAITTGNKHCRKQGCRHEKCSKNFPSESSIASSERVLLHRSLDKIDQAKCLKIKSITTDAGTQSAKAIRDYFNDRKKKAVVHYKCLVHKLRALEKNLRQLHLSSIPKNQDKQSYMRKLASATRARVRLELTKLRKCTDSDSEFVKMSRAATQNIQKCFSGDHRDCPQHSRVCKTYLQELYNHLPYGVALQLNEDDLEAFRGKIGDILDEKSLREVCQLYNTNMCESLNAAVFNYAPKTTLWSRNFSALCHSATHSRTVGAGKSTLQLAAAVGIRVPDNSVIYKQLVAKDKVRLYHRLRQASVKYKQARHYHRKRKMNKSLFKDSLYSTEIKLPAVLWTITMA